MSDTEEFRLRIEAYTPETMPMQRLAQYLIELAQMLGESSAVHFVRLEPGSTSVVHRIEREAVPKVKIRTAAIRRGIGPRDSVRAYHTINRMLREDNGSAVWTEASTAADILVFPGRHDVEETVVGISQRGSIDGEVVRVGGTRDAVPILLRRDQDQLYKCSAGRAVAKSLACRLFEPVRLFGIGRWNRTGEGRWKLDSFQVESFTALRNSALSQALNEIRAIQLDWNNEAFDELVDIRDDREDAISGGV